MERWFLLGLFLFLPAFNYIFYKKGQKKGREEGEKMAGLCYKKRVLERGSCLICGHSLKERGSQKDK